MGGGDCNQVLLKESVQTRDLGLLLETRRSNCDSSEGLGSAHSSGAKPFNLDSLSANLEGMPMLIPSMSLTSTVGSEKKENPSNESSTKNQTISNFSMSQKNIEPNPSEVEKERDGESRINGARIF